MDTISVLKLEDVNGQPKVMLGGLPCPLRVGDPVGLRFRLERQNQGRREVLEVQGQFRVTAVGFEGSTMPRRQLLSVASIHKPPTWCSVRKAPQRAALAPARSLPTRIL